MIPAPINGYDTTSVSSLDLVKLTYNIIKFKLTYSMNIRSLNLTHLYLFDDNVYVVIEKNRPTYLMKCDTTFFEGMASPSYLLCSQRRKS